MVVGMYRFLSPYCAAEEFDSTIGNYFVSVHVALRSGTGLPDDEREMVNELERGDFFGCLLDCFSYFAVL